MIFEERQSKENFTLIWRFIKIIDFGKINKNILQNVFINLSKINNFNAMVLTDWLIFF